MAQIANRGEAVHALRRLEPFDTPRLDAREGRSEYRSGGKGEHDVSRCDECIGLAAPRVARDRDDESRPLGSVFTTAAIGLVQGEKS